MKLKLHTAFLLFILFISKGTVFSQEATPLMLAAKNGNDWQITKLLKSGADVQARDSEGWTALMYAIRYQQNSSTVKLLIENGALVRIRNSYNFTPLLIASLYSHNPDILSMMLKNRNGAEEEVFNAFILSLISNEIPEDIRYEKNKIFLEKEIPINGFWKGMTPLMYACKYGSSTGIIQQLLDYGALASIRNKEGKTAFDYAKENQSLLHDETYWSLNNGNKK